MAVRDQIGDDDTDRVLASLLLRAKLRALIGVPIGITLLGLAVAYEWYISEVMGLRVANLYVVAVGLLPGCLGLYAVVGAGFRIHVVSRMLNHPEMITLLELASTTWGRMAVRAHLRDGATVELETGAHDRERLMARILSRGAG